jgi:hypothetical protein
MIFSSKRLASALAATSVVALGLIGPFTAVAGAQESPTPTLTSATPTLTSATPAPGGTDDVSGSGCVARTTVRVQLDGALLVTTRSTTTGSYSAHLVIPVSVAAGPHRITVLCAGPGGAVTESADVTVALPRTGSNTVRQTAIALAFLLLGSGLLLLTTRRPQRAVRTRT